MRITHYPLHPDTPAEGQSLTALFGAPAEQIERMTAEMRGRLEAEGLPSGPRTMTYNSRLAQEVAAWADHRTERAAWTIHEGFFRAYFEHGRNLGDPAVVLEVAAAAGLPPEETEAVVRDRSFAPHVDADWERSRRLGVTGVPTFVIGERALVGAQPYVILDGWVREAIET